MLSFLSFLAYYGFFYIAQAGRGHKHCPVADVPIIAHTGDPVGKFHNHSGVNYYITGPPSDKGIVYFSDVYGIELLENKLLADSYGRAGYFVVAPDFFNGSAAPRDWVNNAPGFDIQTLLDRSTPEVIDPIVATAIDYLRYHRNISRVAAAGYCFGGRYTFRTLAEDNGVDIGFAAHPSYFTSEEVSAINGSVSVATGDGDYSLPPDLRHQVESLLMNNTNQEYELALYGRAPHGFGVRVNNSDPRQVYAKEEAFFQAIRWFETWFNPQ
ncbi:dienelactone hydrolase [Xylariaceae sp. AK1471]|nr:dienelactone hydrolase [Xylariaceae sp. AK1471]